MGLERLGQKTVHVAIDVQRLFVDPSSPWCAPRLAAVVPRIESLARKLPTLFARFIPAASAAAAPGRWRRYYERWSEVTLERLDPAMLDLVPPLAALAGPAWIVDKPTYGFFGASGARPALDALTADTLVLSGGETEVCVLATLLEAVDRGYRVVLAEDAVASSSLPAHRAILADVLPRFPEQVEIATTADILAAWADR